MTSPRPEADPAVHNHVAEGATVMGHVVQAGTFSGQVHFHYRDQNAPLDLLSLRRWLDRVAEDFRAVAEQDRTGREHGKRLDSTRAVVADPGQESRQRDVIRRLLVAGLCGYLARTRDAAPPPLPEQILLDLVVFALWPVVTARRLPRDWQGELAEITSARLASLVAQARTSWRSGDGTAAETFARALARRSLFPAMSVLFDDLADPRRGGALLTSMALVGGLPEPRTGTARTVFVWAVGIVGGAAAVTVVLDRESQVHRLLEEAIATLPDGSADLDLTELLAEFIDALLEQGGTG
ncbi:hypothetical protein [Actinophytocola xanthii]|uniref:hypothetical protein n=1 Tax=Actinophytocola xanthii TaxID=1912961 RepID=UPI001177592E|nr:hypothetical protein [Actinophytocola xanthii]